MCLRRLKYTNAIHPLFLFFYLQILLFILFIFLNLTLFCCYLIQACPGGSELQICFGKEKLNLQSIFYKMMSSSRIQAPSMISFIAVTSVFSWGNSDQANKCSCSVQILFCYLFLTLELHSAS